MTLNDKVRTAKLYGDDVLILQLGLFELLSYQLDIHPEDVKERLLKDRIKQSDKETLGKSEMATHILKGLWKRLRQSMDQSCKMKPKSLFLIILAILFLGCLINTKKDSNADSALPEKNEDTLADGIKVGHKPPKGLRLSSILYELAVAAEPEKFAKKHDIFLTESKVRVFIFFNPSSSNSERDQLTENYNFMVEKKSDGLLRAVVPIDRLIPLSKESAVWSIRLPDRAIKQ